MKRNNILLIADTQKPYEHQDYLSFLDAVRDKYACGRIIHVGDLLDAYNWSRYGKDPMADNVAAEVTKVREAFDLWGAVFPTVEVVIGNHDRRIRHKLDEAGFGEELLPIDKVYRDIFSLPDKWTLHDDIFLDTKMGPVLVLHGDEYGATVVPGSTMRKVGMSLVRGHHHTRAFLSFDSVKYALRFDMIIGCGIDKKAKAFGYNRKDILRPILACGVLIDGQPVLIPMVVDNNGRWDGKLL